MKKLLRRRPVQLALGSVLGAYLRLMLWTVRWRHENREALEPMLAGGGGAIGLMWHGRIPLALATAPVWWRKNAKCLVSPSADGEFMALALHMNGFAALRASSAKRRDATRIRRAIGALREAVDWVSAGNGLVTPPDGPRGPAEVVQPGMIQIARRTGCPVFLTGLAARPCLRANGSWDRAMFPLPFARGAVVWEGPLYVTSDADIDAVIEDWSARLRAVTRRAEKLVGLAPD